MSKASMSESNTESSW